jgi:hypothetical protein
MHDLVIDNARIVDGTGAPARPGGVAVSGGRITAVGIGAGEAARERLDARGLVLAPASSIPTPTTTRRWPGIPSSPARPGTASPRW